MKHRDGEFLFQEVEKIRNFGERQCDSMHTSDLHMMTIKNYVL